MDDTIHGGGMGWFSFQDPKFREQARHPSIMFLNFTTHVKNRNIDLEVISNK